MPSVLIVDDEKNIRNMIKSLLTRHGMRAVAADSAEAGLEELKRSAFSLALIDYMMPGMNGIEMIEQMQREPSSAPPAILMTAYGSIETAVAAMRAGAVDFIAKPFTPEELLHAVTRNVRAQRLEREVKDLRSRVDGEKIPGGDLIAESPAMKAVMKEAAQVASSKAPVLIEGETGVGKERVARFIHEASPRATSPFVAVNCGALHPELLLSELFGHRRGAFTGAVEDRIGRFEAADGGTLFLDEIGELDAGAQVKLLRVLQEETFERVGDTRTISVDVRVIAATNRSLKEMVDAGSFRADLYYRVAVMTITVPPLRERPSDITALAGRFLQEFASDTGRALRWADGALDELARRDWPGNVRELRNVIHRAVLMTPRESDLVRIAANDTPADARRDEQLFAGMQTRGWTLEDIEREYIAYLLAQPDARIGDICARLAIDPATLWRKRKKYGL